LSPVARTIPFPFPVLIPVLIPLLIPVPGPLLIPVPGPVDMVIPPKGVGVCSRLGSRLESE
jgi:hypothetical protein